MDMKDNTRGPASLQRECGAGELVVFVGAVRPAEYESLRRRGLRLALLYERTPLARIPAQADFVEIADVSLAGDEPLHVLQRWRDRYGTLALLVTVEWGVMHHAALAEALDLPGPSREAAALALDKTAMRRRFLERLGPDSTAAIEVISDERDLRSFGTQHGYPFVLKPTNLYGSMYVSQVSDIEEAVAAYRWTMPGVRHHLDRVGRQDEAVVIQAEALLRGSCHSIDFIVDAGGSVHGTPVVDVVVGRDIGWDDFHHFARVAPSRMSEAQEVSAAYLAGAGCQALGLSGCVAHVEFISTSAGPRLLEIGARPGGNRVRMLQEVFGIDLMYSYYLMQGGKAFDLAPTRRRPMGVVTPFPRREGRFRKCLRPERLSALPTYSSHVVKALPGEWVGPARRGYLPPLNIELVGSTIDELDRDARAISSFDDLIETDDG
ncbi:ATP-grasp domain-containing protein [Sorangium sp. So ce1128]